MRNLWWATVMLLGLPFFVLKEKEKLDAEESSNALG